nr:salicylate carboxymethyltransferase [Quercus suber]
MEVVQVLHMNGGMGETSYANNSLVQQKVISLTRPIIEEAITDLYCRTLPRSLAIADLGCSSGPNTLFVVSELIKVVEKLRKKLGHESLEYQVFLNDLPGNDFNTIFKSLPSFQKQMSCQMGPGAGPCLFSGTPGSFYEKNIKVVEKLRKKLGHESLEYQVFLNDLPGNDFNTIFKSLPSFQKQMSCQMGPGAGPCLFSGTPGSFYGRLFPSNSLHFVHSSYSLQWLSQVPEGLDNNKGNIYMASTSPPSVLRAYYEQFQRDFSVFLKCRAEELMVGGGMVLTFLGRRSEDPSSKECCYIWELLAMALNDMISEGLIEEDKMDSFNFAQYTPSPSEVKSEVLKGGYFSIDRLEVSAVKWNDYDSEFNPSVAFSDDGYSVANCMRAVAEPLLVNQFGDATIDEVFRRYRKIIADHISKEKTQFINVTISMKKSGHFII